MSSGRGWREFSARSRPCGPFQLFQPAPQTAQNPHQAAAANTSRPHNPPNPPFLAKPSQNSIFPASPRQPSERPAPHPVNSAKITIFSKISLQSSFSSQGSQSPGWRSQPRIS